MRDASHRTRPTRKAVMTLLFGFVTPLLAVSASTSDHHRALETQEPPYCHAFDKVSFFLSEVEPFLCEAEPTQGPFARTADARPRILDGIQGFLDEAYYDPRRDGPARETP